MITPTGTDNSLPIGPTVDWDVDFIDEFTLGRLGLRRFEPDGMGPNLERFGGAPYPYIPSIRIFSFQNPGYKF